MVGKIQNSASTDVNLRHVPQVNVSRTDNGQSAPKTIGETPPQKLSLSQIGQLALLFDKNGKISRLQRKLNKIKGKKCQVTPAKGTIACVDGNDLVFLGVEFLEEFQDQEDILLGVMAHEWGHACADRPQTEDIEGLNWDQIFELRKSHEVLADEISGRMLALLGYPLENYLKFIRSFLSNTHNLKYHDNETRAQIVSAGYNDEVRKLKLATELFKTDGYKGYHVSKLIDDDV